MRWEYMVLDEHSEWHLNNYGEAGWELVCVYNGSAYLKREITP